MVRLTPNGLSVRPRQRAISFTRSSGVGCVSAVMKPSARALSTAATSSARPTHCIPPCTIGCSTPTSSVNRVLIILTPDSFHEHFPTGKCSTLRFACLPIANRCPLLRKYARGQAAALFFRVFRGQDAVRSGKCLRLLHAESAGRGGRFAGLPRLDVVDT